MSPSSADRASFPAEALTWLVGPNPGTIATIGQAEIAAALDQAGHRVAAVAHGGRLPFVAQTLHAVIADRTLPADLDAVAPMLRPGGRMALVVSARDRRIPFARKIDDALGVTPAEDPADDLVTSKRFGFVEEESFRWWQNVTAESLVATLTPELAHLPAEEREEKLDAVRALYDDYGRGHDGMQLPWVTRCWKASVVEQVWQTPASAGEAEGDADTSPEGSAEQAPTDPPDDDDSMLLIDFR